MTKSDSFDFAASMSELEKIVADLEEGSLDLARAMEEFERGAKIAADLQTYLRDTKLKINQIKEKLDSTTENS